MPEHALHLAMQPALVWWQAFSTHDFSRAHQAGPLISTPDRVITSTSILPGGIESANCRWQQASPGFGRERASKRPEELLHRCKSIAAG